MLVVRISPQPPDIKYFFSVEKKIKKKDWVQGN